MLGERQITKKNVGLGGGGEGEEGGGRRRKGVSAVTRNINNLAESRLEQKWLHKDTE